MNYYYTGVDNSAYLAHYGVLGMKWGVRRTPEQLGHRVIKAGTTFYRSSPTATDSNETNKYVSYTDPDRDLYRSSKSYLRDFSTDGSLYETTYTSVKDIIAPSYNETAQIVAETLKRGDNAKKFQDAGKTYLIKQMSSEYQEFAKSELTKSGKTLSDKALKKYAENECRKDIESNYGAIVQNMGAIEFTFRVIATNSDLRNEVAKTAKDKGFNAISDVHGVGTKSRQIGVDPLIVLDTESTLQKVSTVKVDDAVADQAAKDYAQWYRNVN